MKRQTPRPQETTRTSKTTALLAAVGAAGLTISLLARRRRRIDLHGRVVVITGGGRGLGLAIAREFANRGARLALCGRDAQTVEGAAEELRRTGVEVFGEACDVADSSAVTGFMERVLAHYGTIDVLVNNAGQCFVGPAVELEARDVDDALRNIFWVHYWPTMAVLPSMRQRRFGRIVNITSVDGKVPLPHQAAYVAGKFAATGWSETLGTELAKEGIRVSTITPPPLRNGAPLHVHFHGRAEQEFAWFTRILTSRAVAISAERAAKVVVDAAVHGDLARAVSFGSWFFARLHGLLPSWSLSLLQLVDRTLPPSAPPGQTSPTKLGADVYATSTDRVVRALGERARSDASRYRSVPTH